METQVQTTTLNLPDNFVNSGRLAIGNHFLYFDVLDSRRQVGDLFEIRHEAGYNFGTAKLVAMSTVPLQKVSDVLGYIVAGVSGAELRRHCVRRYSDAMDMPWATYAFAWVEREPSAFEVLTKMHINFSKQRKLLAHGTEYN